MAPASQQRLPTTQVADVNAGRFMIVEELADKSGEVYAFQVQSILIPLKRIIKLLQRESSVAQIKTRSVLECNPDVHCEFVYRGERYMIWEPYGDSSRYWVGPISDEAPQVDISPLVQLFQNYRVGFMRQLIFQFARIFE